MADRVLEQLFHTTLQDTLLIIFFFWGGGGFIEFCALYIVFIW